MLVAGSEGVAIHPAAAPREGEPIVGKHRISPFVGTDLETLLRANGVDTLVLAGVHTSGVVLSTVRHASDLDYRLVVVRDCCADPNAELHAMLLDVVLAAVVTTAELGALLKGPPGGAMMRSLLRVLLAALTQRLAGEVAQLGRLTRNCFFDTFGAFGPIRTAALPVLLGCGPHGGVIHVYRRRSPTSVIARRHADLTPERLGEGAFGNVAHGAGDSGDVAVPAPDQAGGLMHRHRVR